MTLILMCMCNMEKYRTEHLSFIYLFIYLSIYLFLTFKKLFIYLFMAVLGLRCYVWAFLQLRRAGATLRCGARASHCGGFSCCGARALGAWASVVVAPRLSSCGLWALEHRLSSCGAWAQLLRTMWDLPRPGLKPMSPALAGGFLTIAPPGKSQHLSLNQQLSQSFPGSFSFLIK